VPPGGFLAHLASRGAALLGVADQSPPIAAP
jgi:hypothetical protein